MRSLLPLGLALAAALDGAARAQSVSAFPLDRFLTQHAHVSDRDLAGLARGTPIVRTLAAGDPKEIVVAGAIRMGIPARFYVEQFRDIVRMKRSEDVLQIGKFGNPPSADDAAALRLDHDDVEALRKCRPEDCDIRVTGAMLDRVRTGMDWTARDLDARASQRFQHALAERAAAFLRDGDRALGRFVARDTADAAAAFTAVLKRTPWLQESAPDAHDYLARFPQAPLAGAEQFVYWSKEVWGPARVVTLTHVTIAPRVSTAAGEEFLILTRDVYATHLLDASLGVVIVSDRGDADRPACDVAYVNHSRAPALQGFLGGLRRSLVQRRQRDAMDRSLRALKERLEAAYRGR